MTAHFITTVLPGSAMGLDYDVPLLVFGGESPDDLAQVPLATSIHRIDNEIQTLEHASLSGVAIPVNNAWITAVEQYDQAAKIVIIRDPVPAGTLTTHVPVAEGVESGLPDWLGEMLAGTVRWATRDVPVSAGTGPASIMMDMRPAGATLEEWADLFLPEAGATR